MFFGETACFLKYAPKTIQNEFF